MAESDVTSFSELIAALCVPLLGSHTNKILSYKQIKKYSEIDPAYIEKHVPHHNISYTSHDKTSSLPTEQYDIVIVPCVGVSKNGDRVGYGGGWYDRFLATQNHARKIYLCYESCVIDTIPKEPHDIRADYIVTEHRVIDCTVE
jgi:5-formyltetrahydrofolate cyclo-ligase